MPASMSIINKVFQFTQNRQTKKSQAQAQQQSKHLNSPIKKSNGLILLPVLAQPHGGPSCFGEEFESESELLLQEKEKPLDLFPVLLSVSPQGKENETPALSTRQLSKLERRRQRLEAGLEIRFFSCESSNSTMDSLLTLVPDCQKPLPALPLPELSTPDYDKPLPPTPEIEDDFTFFLDKMCRECGVVEGNTQKGMGAGL
jgi:hypothetical protein